MEALLSRFPLSLLCPSPPHHSPSQTHFPNALKISLTTHRNGFSRRDTIAFAANPNDPKPKESTFMDEDGVVDDMDGYLNYLSLEYDSVWDTKPSWKILKGKFGEYGARYVFAVLISSLWLERCQPWTIMLTGISVIACSWLILHSTVITSLVLCVISLWWYLFLYSYPKAYLDMIAERRKKVTSGVEDTFGLKKRQ